MNSIPEKILIIQTAFIGDAILSTSLVESWANKYPKSSIDILVRKGNESLFFNNPHINEILIWDKKGSKYANLLKLRSQIKANKYDAVFTIQRFLSTGILTAFSGAKIRSGYDSNPLSFLFSHKSKFETDKGLHETERNIKLFAPFYTEKALKPKLYPSQEDNDYCQVYKEGVYLCMAPTSVWFTKQWPKENWIRLIQKYSASDNKIYLLGAPSDFEACEEIRLSSENKNVVNLAGKLSFLQSASLMKDARMNYVNDSAPMHIASAMNAPTTAIYCSTLPSFGFGPLADSAKIIEYKEDLECRPCGLHGKSKCPEGHFKCSDTIDQLLV